MNKLNQKNKLNRQQLAFGALELAAWVLQNYQQFAPKEIEKLGKIFNLFVKIIEKSSQSQKQLFFAHDAETGLLPSQINTLLAPLDDKLREAKQAYINNDKYRLGELLKQCDTMISDLKSKDIDQQLRSRIRDFDQLMRHYNYDMK